MVIGTMTVAMDDKGGDDRNTMIIQMIAKTTPVVKIVVVPMQLMTMLMAIMGTQM